ncbi:hypothetical protein B5P46_28250 [Rhizobium leguminosarum]|uniref:Uncharacterized protein n=1 Tax=Rhizobium leguminosarum TaxID=384 RepID=A0A4Q1TKN5_RHILE|nr:hypothetical protein [Rhizobium leguminosarum]RXT18783.1 hypothetical protein B5P46_28250 [Rhizobium leguminosarum]
MNDRDEEFGDDDLVPLAKACRIFLHDHLTKSSLRTESRKGTLEIIRIANKDFVTRNGIRRMIEKCTVRNAVQAPPRVTAKEALRLKLDQRKKTGRQQPVRQ